MPSPLELVAHGRTEEEVAEHIGADLVIYQTLPDLIESCRQCNPSIQTFDCSVFTGEYVTGGVDERYLEHLEKLRNDKAKTKKMENGVQEAQMLSESCNGPMSGLSSFVMEQDRTDFGFFRWLGLFDRSAQSFTKDRTSNGYACAHWCGWVT